MRKRKLIWLIIKLAMLLLSIIVFTPLITPKGDYSPELLGFPYTLWTGIVIYILMIILNFIGVSVHAKIYNNGNDYE